jgi:hypothetical protein
MIRSVRRGTRPLLAVLALALVFSSVAAVSLYPLGWDKDSLPANADALYCSWAVAWIARTLPHAPSEVFAANILHPDPAPLAYNDPMLAVGALAVPIYALTGSSVTTYNATLILTLALSALTMFLLGRELSGSAWAGVIAGASFAFTTANYDSLARIQVISSQWTPLSLFFLVRTLRSRRWRDGMGCGLAFALQGLACSYYEAFFAVLLLAAFPVFLAVTPRPRVRQFPWGPLVGGAALAASLLLPVNLIQHRQLSRVESARSEAQTATLDNYLAADPGNWIHARVFGASGLGYDARYFPGLIPVALALVGTLVMLRRRRDLPESSRYVIPIAWLGLFALALALGDRVSTPWGDVPGPLAALRPWVPGLAETRVPARFVMFARVAMSALAAMGAAALLRALRARPRLAVSTGLVLALAVPLEHLSTPIDTWRVPVGEAVPPVYRWLAEQPEVAVVEFPPFPVRRRREETLWLHLSALHWQRIANGYASFYPAHYDLFVNTLLDLPSPLAFEMLRVMQVEMVVFHPRAREDAEGQRATRRLDAALPELLGSQLEEVASFVEGEHAGSADRLGVLGGERVFRVLPRESPRPERRRLTPESRYSRAGWRCEATTPGCELTLDGQPDTHFVTGSPQLAGDHLRVLFPRPLVVRGVSLASGRWSQFYPVEAKLLALFDGHWELVPHRENRLEFLQDLLRDPWHASLEMHLRQPMTVSGLEIRLGHGSAFNPWIVPELYVHR